MDKLYRAVLTVRNRGSSALKCLTSVPAALRGVLEFVPDLFFLQVSMQLELITLPLHVYTPYSNASPMGVGATNAQRIPA